MAQDFVRIPREVKTRLETKIEILENHIQSLETEREWLKSEARVGRELIAALNNHTDDRSLLARHLRGIVRRLGL